mgnify:CR=1 FL=1
MELKLGADGKLGEEMVGSNRTFMELKSKKLGYKWVFGVF